MFTGIIQELGHISKVTKQAHGKTFTIKTGEILKKKKIGDSIAINGVCLTVTKLSKNNLEVEAIEETLYLTNLKNLQKNNLVNLESSLAFGSTIDGHLVQGHVDTTAIVEKFSKEKNKASLTIKFPEKISKFLAYKGSITINGVSLTISDLQANNFTVELIPHTLKKTNLQHLKKGDEVNLEIDLISRYLERLLERKDQEAKYEFLKERNLI